MKNEVKSVSVTLSHERSLIYVECSPQEAFNLLMMPSFAGLISMMVPNYGLSSVSEPENKE